jgi:hypothetical protein
MSGRKHSDESRKIISEAKIGSKLSDQTRKNMSDAKAGENNPMFEKIIAMKLEKKYLKLIRDNQNPRNQVSPLKE